MIIKPCLFCGKDFEAKYKEQKFCSQKCYGGWSSINKRGENHNQWNGGKVKCNCIICNNEFYVKPSQIKIGGGKFCSLKCNGIWHSENMSGENCPNWDGGKIKGNCIVCNKEIYRNPFLIKRGWNKFCSKKCHGIWDSKNRCGENCFNWQGGKSFEPYGVDFNNNKKELVRSRDNHKCQECGVPEMECNNKLSVHHIDYDKQNNDPINLISLCHSCHMKTNINREYWKLYFKEKLNKCLNFQKEEVK